MDSYGALAAYYDRLMSHVDYDRWAEYALSLLGLDRAPASGSCGGPAPGRTGAAGSGREGAPAPPREEAPAPLILDLACGTGSIAVRLAAEGMRVIGVDRSAEMLAAAEAKAREWEVAVELVQADLALFEAAEQADGAVCLFDSLNYLTSVRELRAALRNAAAALRPGARLVFDVHTAERLRQVGSETYGHVEDDLAYLWMSEYDEESRICAMQVTLFVADEATGLFRRHDEVHYERAHTKSEIEEALDAAGFELEAVHGPEALDAAVFGEGRAFYVARRR